MKGLTWPTRKKMCKGPSCHNLPTQGIRYCAPCFGEMVAERKRLFREVTTCNEPMPAGGAT